jgi:hypothetical protein
MPKTRSLVFPDDLYRAIKKRAKLESTPDKKVNFSEIVRRAIRFYLGLDPELLRIANRYAAMLDTEPVTVISNMAIDKVAHRDAEIEVFGPTQRHLFEFQKIEGQLATGKALYDALKDSYMYDFMRKKEQMDEERY